MFPADPEYVHVCMHVCVCVCVLQQISVTGQKSDLGIAVVTSTEVLETKLRGHQKFSVSPPPMDTVCCIAALSATATSNNAVNGPVLQ